MTFFSRKPRNSGPHRGSNPSAATTPHADIDAHAHLEPKPASTAPSEAAIRARAHQLWLARGSAPGDDLADWLRAEDELRQELRSIEAAARDGGTT